jgi:uncharacterized protein (DUF952 family)
LALATIYKICDRTSWRVAEAEGNFRGSPDDVRDGFIHFSTASQVAGTLAKHFSKQADLIVAAIDTEALGAALKWERSRGGDLFPHLYGALPFSAVRWSKALPDEIEGQRAIPELEP